MLAIAALSPVARAQDNADMRVRLEQMENDLQTLNRAVYKGETPPPSSAPLSLQSPANPAAAQAGFDARFSQLERELTAMTGRLEEIQHQMQIMQQGIDQTAVKLDARLTALEQKQEAAAPPPAEQPVGSLTGTDMAKPDLAQPDNEGHPGEGHSGDGHFGGGTTSSSAPAALGTLNRPVPDDAGKPAADSPDLAYEQAYANIKVQKYDEAEQAFTGFLARYPKHPLAANAQYWLGESYYGRDRFDKAAKAFALAYQNYPQSPKGPESLLKLGLSLNSLGKHNEACLTWGQLKKQFPSASPVLSRAAVESQKNACKS